MACIARESHHLPEDLAARRLLRRDDVRAHIPVSTRTLHRWMAERGFPKPRQIAGTWVWVPGEVAAWIAGLPRGIGIKPPDGKEEPALERLLTVNQVLELVPVSRCTLTRWQAAGRFPAPLVIGMWGTQASAPSYFWRESEFFTWLDSLPRVHDVPTFPEAPGPNTDGESEAQEVLA